MRCMGRMSAPCATCGAVARTHAYTLRSVRWFLVSTTEQSEERMSVARASDGLGVPQTRSQVRESDLLEVAREELPALGVAAPADVLTKRLAHA